jgi:catechol 2,3-dioxygenase-like lactoylglutathione lyase family enzyme
MPIGASLACIELSSADPQALADFYCRTYGMEMAIDGDLLILRAPQREFRLRRGAPNQLVSASYRFATTEACQAHRRLLANNDVQATELDGGGHAVTDPEGRRIQFLPPAADTALTAGNARVAKLQHIGVRTTAPQALLNFYVNKLGFTLSDRVLNEDGDLTAAFARTDDEHHSLAIFRAPEIRFDHFSCETTGWMTLRVWADHMASVQVPLAWGVGRHGPGDDTFFMVKDPEGNLAEISSDLEVCANERPVGVWPHSPLTLNQWGVAIMRS